MICPKCKREYVDDTQFCDDCGCRLIDLPTAQPVPVVAPAPAEDPEETYKQALLSIPNSLASFGIKFRGINLKICDNTVILCFDGFMDAPSFCSKYKLHPEPSPFNFFFSYGMAVNKIQLFRNAFQENSGARAFFLSILVWGIGVGSF